MKKFMDNDKIISLIQSLNNLFLEPSLHRISFLFDKASEVLRKENLKIEIIESKTYYLIEELNSLYEMGKRVDIFKEKEWKMWRLKEKEVLAKYAGTEGAIKKQEPSFFEFKNNRIIGYLCREKESEKLIWNLIEAYNLKRDDIW